MNLTVKQQKARDTIGSDILVSAAAGSGKTTVMIERIKNILLSDDLKKKASVDELLILTFTNDAARQMKQKLLKAIKKEIKASQNNKEKKELLLDELDKIHTANISTFHSFLQKIIKEHFYRCDIDASARILDETECEILKHKSIDNVFKNRLNDENLDNREIFKNFLYRYAGSKNENSLKLEIINLFDKLMTMPNPFKILELKVEQLKLDDNNIQQEIKTYFTNKIHTAIKDMSKAKIDLAEFLDAKGYATTAKKEREKADILERFLDHSFEYNISENISKVYEDISSVRIAKEDGKMDESLKKTFTKIKDEYTDAKKRLDEFKKYDDIEEVFDGIRKTHHIGGLLFDLLKEFYNEYSLLKAEKKGIDFSDIEHIAISLLQEEDIGKEYRAKFKYIFVDEYQDTNDIQEYILNLIKKENNLFMVGDIKQSIYRFRMAEPEIFQNKYNIFQDVFEREENGNFDKNIGVKIDLNENFRTKSKVVDGINSVFEKLMVGYDHNARLNAGREEFDVDADNLLLNEMKFIILNSWHKEYLEDIGFDKILDEEDLTWNQLDVDIRDLKDIYIEALEIAREIKQLIGKKYFVKTIYKDEITGEKKEILKEKSITYKDIVILSKSIKNSIDVFKHIFKKNDIPFYANNESGYFDKMEIKLGVNLLKTIENNRENIALVSCLLSPIFSFTPEDLGRLRLLDKKKKYIDLIDEYAQNEKEDKLTQKCQVVLKKLSEWKKKVKEQSLEEFLRYLIEDSRLYQYVGTLTDGSQRQLNLRTFVDKAKNYEENSKGRIRGFLRYIETMEDKRISVGESTVNAEYDNTVKMMTIHKSKGLEFPIVFLCDTNKQFRSVKEGIKGNFFLSKDYGIFIRDVDIENKEINDNILKSMIKDEELKKNLEEEVRNLYVAMTRAMDSLFIIGTVNDIGEIDKDRHSYLSYIYKDLDEKFVKLQRGTDIRKVVHLIPKRENINKNILEDMGNKEISIDVRKLKEKRRQIFDNKRNNDNKVKSKYSVSEINKKDDTSLKYDNIKLQYELNKVNLGEKIKISGSVVGSIYHKVMEKLNFNDYEKRGNLAILDVIKKIDEADIYEESVEKIVSVEKIEKFLNSDLGRRMVNHSPVREKEFRMLYDKDGVSTIVQGIIDCYFIEDDEVVLIDYKTNKNIENLREEYKIQLSFYKQALEEGLSKRVKEVWLYSFKEDKGIKLGV